jgi:hypothetical protein
LSETAEGDLGGTLEGRQGLPDDERHPSLPGGDGMTSRQPRNLAASVRQRLITLSRERGEEFQLVLTRYGLERLLYRLTQ